MFISFVSSFLKFRSEQKCKKSEKKHLEKINSCGVLIETLEEKAQQKPNVSARGTIRNLSFLKRKMEDSLNGMKYSKLICFFSF